MNKTIKKWAIVLVGLALITVFFATGTHHYLTLEALKEQKIAIDSFYQSHRLLTMFLYFTIYVAVTALSLPGAAILTLAGGAVFGLGMGTVIVSFSSTIGASCAFLVARYLFQDTVQNKFGDKLETINKGIREEGAFYLFTLRLIPAFPFFMINLLMGMTSIRLITFFFVSQAGMLPGTIVYVNAGTQLGKLNSLKDIGSPELLGSFILLGLFPLIVKKLMGRVRAQRSK